LTEEISALKFPKEKIRIDPQAGVVTDANVEEQQNEGHQAFGLSNYHGD